MVNSSDWSFGSDSDDAAPPPPPPTRKRDAAGGGGDAAGGGGDAAGVGGGGGVDVGASGVGGEVAKRHKVLPKPRPDININSPEFTKYINDHLKSNQAPNVQMDSISKYSHIQKLLKSFLIKIHSEKIQIPVVEDDTDDPTKVIELYIESIQDIIVRLISGESIDYDTALTILNTPHTAEAAGREESMAEDTQEVAEDTPERIRDISSRLLTYTTEELDDEPDDESDDEPDDELDEQVICQLFYGKSIDEIFPPVPLPGGGGGGGGASTG